MDNYKLIIKDDDLLGLLLNKVPYIWQALDYSLKSDSAYQPPCLYKESVQVLRAVEKFVGDLKSGRVPCVAQLGINVTMHAEFDRSFLVYFNALKFEREMFDMAYLWLGLNWAYYQKFLKEGAVKLSSTTAGIEQILSNSEGSQERTQQWSPSKFTYDKAWGLINFFSDVQNNSFYIKKTDKWTQQVVDNINHAFENFDKLLTIHQEVYILVIDVRFVRTVNPAKNESFGRLIEQVLEDRTAITNDIIQLISDCLFAYTKLEHDYQNGLKLSCILILRSRGIDQEEEVIARLRVLLKKNFSHYDAIDVINGNEFVRTHAKKYAVGRIGINSPTRVEQFKCWVLSYFFKIDLFVKLQHPEKTFEVNEILGSPNWHQPKIISSKKDLLPQTLIQILKEWKTPKRIWDVRHLTKRVVDRLLVGQIYYREFCTEQGLPKQYGELLFQLEVFIETLLHNGHQGFVEVSSAHQQDFLNIKDIKISATQLGQQYLSLMTQDENSLYFMREIDQLLKRGGLRTWWFNQEDNFILWLRVKILLQNHPFNRPVNFTVLGQLNIKLQGVQRYLISKQPLVVNKRELLEKHYTQCVRRQMDTREYLDRVLEQNCWVYRIVVDARSTKGSFKQSELSKLFTEFMRLAKRAKPCYWLRGYMGVWQENSWQVMSEFTLDAVLFFNDRCQEQLQTVVHDLDQRWNSFLDTKAAQTLKLQDAEDIKYYGAIKPKILMCSVDGLNTADKVQNPYYVCLEAHDRKMKKMVIEHVIPYFAYRDVFQTPLSQPVPKAFIKGAMLKK